MYNTAYLVSYSSELDAAAAPGQLVALTPLAAILPSEPRTDVQYYYSAFICLLLAYFKAKSIDIYKKAF